MQGEKGSSGPLPLACLGDGAANARVIREARARNLDIIMRDKECGLGLKEKEKGEGGGETGDPHTLYRKR